MVSYLILSLTPMCVRQWCELSKLLYYNNITAEVLINLINADKRIKEMQIGDDEIKILPDITCLNRMLVILRLYEKDKLVQR